MKKVLVVGAGSYICDSFARYVQGRLEAATVSSLDSEWQRLDYSGFDSVIFAAGIAHRKQSAGDKDLYFAVNRDLAVSVAQKAKREGAGQFVYFSSLYALGVVKGEISKAATPADYYGLSKYQAEKQLEPMQSENFRVAIVRPPMVYGRGCRGNFPQLVKIAKTLPVIPTIGNKRSMIYIDNLTELLAIVVEMRISGALCPQNREYVCTANAMAEISLVLGKRCFKMPLLNPFIRLLSPFSPALQSAFGSLYYSAEISQMPFSQSYQLVGFEESIRKSVMP